MSVVTQLYFQIVEENNYMFRPFSGWAIIRLRLEYRRKLSTTIWTSRMGELDLVLRYLEEVCSSFPLTWCPHCSIWVFSDILVSACLWPIQKRAETCSWFLHQFENTVVLRRTFIHLISTSIESHNGDDATKDVKICWSFSVFFLRWCRPCVSGMFNTVITKAY
jgi:hypothetical protein